MMKPRRIIDWVSIQADYAKGMSMGRLAKLYGVDPSYLRQMKKKQGWPDQPRCEDRSVSLAPLPPFVEHMGPRTPEEHSLAPLSDTQKAVVDKLIEEIADLRKTALFRHLGTIDEVAQLIEKYMELVNDWLSGDEQRMQKAARMLFVAKNDSIHVAVRTLLVAVEMRQRLERDVLGMESSKFEPDGERQINLTHNQVVVNAKDFTPDELLGIRTALAKLTGPRPESSSGT